MNGADELRAGWLTAFQPVHTSRAATRILIGYVRVSPFVRGSPQGPIVATC